VVEKMTALVVAFAMELRGSRLILDVDS